MIEILNVIGVICCVLVVIASAWALIKISFNMPSESIGLALVSNLFFLITPIVILVGSYQGDERALKALPGIGPIVLVTALIIFASWGISKFLDKRNANKQKE